MTRSFRLLLFIAAAAHAQLPPWMIPQPDKPVTVPAPPPAPKSTASGSLRAQLISASKITKENWRTDWGSYDRDYERMHHIEVRLLPWGKGETAADLEWIWFGRGLEHNGARVVLKRGRQAVTLKGGAGPQIILLHSGIILGSVANYAALGERDAEGEKIEGWYVRLLVDGQTVSDATSSSYLADVARNPGKLGALHDYTNAAPRVSHSAGTLFNR